MEIIQLVDELRKRLWRRAPLLYIPGRSVRKVYKKNGTAQLEWIRHVDIYTRHHVVTVVFRSDSLFEKHGEKLTSILENVLTEWNYEGNLVVFSRSGRQIHVSGKGEWAQEWSRIVEKHRSLFFNQHGVTRVRGFSKGVAIPSKTGVWVECVTRFHQTFSTYDAFDQWLTRIEQEEEEMKKWKTTFYVQMENQWGDVFVEEVQNEIVYHTGTVMIERENEPYVKRSQGEDGFVYQSSVFGKHVSYDSWETFQVQIEQEWNEALRIRSLRSLLK